MTENALDKPATLLRAPQYIQLQQFFDDLKANQEKLRKSVKLTADEKGKTLEQVEKMEAKTVTVEHRKGFNDEDLSGWDDRLSRADYVDVSGLNNQLTKLTERLPKMSELQERVEKQRDAVVETVEKAQEQFTEQATETDELERVRAEVAEKLAEVEGRRGELEATLKGLREQAEAVAKEKEAIEKSVNLNGPSRDGYLDGDELASNWDAAAKDEKRSKRGHVDLMDAHLERAKSVTLAEATHLYQYAVDAVVDARSEKRTRLLSSWRQGTVEAVAGLSVRGANDFLARRVPVGRWCKRVSTPLDRVVLRGAFAAWRAALELVGELPPEPTPDVEEVPSDMSVEYRGFLYCALPPIEKDAVNTDVTGPQTLLAGWEPVPEKDPDLEALLENVVFPFGWGADLVALECADQTTFGMYPTTNAGGASGGRHPRSAEKLQWKQGRAVSHYNSSNIRMLLRRPAPSAPWARPASSLLQDGTVMTHTSLAATNDAGRGPKPVISALRMAPSAENTALATKWSICRGVGEDWHPSTVGDEDGALGPYRHLRSRVEKGAANLNRVMTRSLLLAFTRFRGHASAEGWFEAKKDEVVARFPLVDAHLDSIGYHGRKDALEARLGGADGDPLGKLVTVAAAGAAVKSRLEDYAKLAQKLGAPADKLLRERADEVAELRAMVAELEAGAPGRVARVAELQTEKDNSCRELFKVVEHKATKVDVKGVVQDVLLLWKAIEGLEKSKTDRAELQNLREAEDDLHRNQETRLNTFVSNGKLSLGMTAERLLRAFTDDVQPVVEEHTEKFQALQEMLKKLSIFVEEMVTKLTELSYQARQRLRPAGMVRTGGGFKRATESRVNPRKAQLDRPPRLGEALSAASLEDGCNRWLQYANNMLQEPA